MNCKELFETIDALNETYLDIWEAAANLESPTTSKAGVDACGEYLAEIGRRLGFAVTVCPQEVAGDAVCITMNPDANAAPICFSGHIDTVHPIGSFGTPAVRRDGKNLYGPGVMDCKGGVIASLLAMDALKRCGFTARPIRLILQTDEEKNSNPSGKDTLRFMREMAEGAAFFLNCESIVGSSAVTERKGIVQFKFTVTGKAIHSSKCALGASAIAEAAHKILALEQFKDPEDLTCNIGLIDGGTAVNTVPQSCSFFADFRFNNAAQLRRAREFVSDLTAKNVIAGTTTTAVESSCRPAMEKADRNYALLDRLNAIYSECGLPTLDARKSLGGSDAAYVTEWNIPCLDSVGVAGDFIHTENEYAELASLAESAKRLAAAAYLY